MPAWALVQFGGMALVVWFAGLKPVPGALPVPWDVVIMIYALAKLLVAGDHQIYDLTSHLVSGHSLEHLVENFAAWSVLAALGGSVRAHPGAWPRFHKTSAECPTRLQLASSRPLLVDAAATGRLPAVKTNVKRSQA